MAECESGGCIEVDDHDGHIRVRSTITSTTCQATTAEFVTFRDRMKAGEFDHIGQDAEVTL